MATAITNTSFFGRYPWKARASIPDSGATQAHGTRREAKRSNAEGFSHTKEGSRAHFRAKETEIKRYYTKTTRSNYRHNSEIGFECSCASFQSFKNRFSYLLSRPSGTLPSKLAFNNSGHGNSKHSSGLHTRFQFSSGVTQMTLTTLPFSQTDSQKIDFEIETLLEKGALRIAKPCSDQFISNLFLVPKRDGLNWNFI